MAMQIRRPTPLTDDLFIPGVSPAPILLGATNNGQPLPVKNTFLDVPSGLTPTSVKNEWYKPQLSAPAGMSKPLTIPEEVPGSPLDFIDCPHAISADYGCTPPFPSSTTSTPRMTPGAVLAPFPHLAPPPLQLVRLEHPPDAPDPPDDVPEVTGFEPPCGDDEEGEEESDSDEEELPQHLRHPENAPKPPPGALHPSLGSRAHASGLCKRCCFFPRGRCMNGYDCEFCHYEHDKRKRKNKKKRTKVLAMRAMGQLSAAERQRLRATASTLDARRNGRRGQGRQQATASTLLPGYCGTQETAPVGQVIVQGPGGQQFLVCAPTQICGMPGQQPVVGLDRGAVHMGHGAPGNVQVLLQNAAQQQTMQVVMLPMQMPQQGQLQQPLQQQFAPLHQPFQQQQQFVAQSAHMAMQGQLPLSTVPQRRPLMPQAPAPQAFEPPPAPTASPCLRRRSF